MKPGARLLVLEELIPETPELVPGKWIDLLMLAITGGRERTEKEYRELLSRALRIRRSGSDDWSGEHPHSKTYGRLRSRAIPKVV
jgi:O-methyltransferase domain